MPVFWITGMPANRYHELSEADDCEKRGLRVDLSKTDAERAIVLRLSQAGVEFELGRRLNQSLVASQVFQNVHQNGKDGL